MRYRAEVYDFWGEELLVTYTDVEADTERAADEIAAVRADFEGHGDCESLDVRLTKLSA